ncbi:MAG: hypothetical protein H0T45_19725 [Pyrinomonadaceae bacterium]|nr:hypothetical protein [Pyrinomonadaceae bacterium]
MKRATYAARPLATAMVVLCLLAAPIAVLAKKGEKNYKRGLEHEAAQQWDRAAQEFALAVAASPSDTEYQLHYRRAIFQASQKFMEQGRTLFEQDDYKGAYNAYRQAYGYDPVNELALAEMQRMLRLQREKEGGDDDGKPAAATGAQISPTAYQPGANGTNGLAARGAAELTGLPAGRSEQQRIINYGPADLEEFIRTFAKELDLNVIFDRDFPKRTLKINLTNVTTAKALDYVFLSQGIFFQKLDRRTILVADQSKRPQYQQLVLRTFYLQNIEPEKARALIQTALPPNAGRQPAVTPNKETNSLTVRDTPENIRLIAQLLNAIDKDRAEVVMDVQIYELSRTNLLTLGNQIGDQNSLSNLGGVQPSSVLFGGGAQRVLTGTGMAAAALPTVLGGAFLLPTTTLSAFQSKQNTRLIASTQVHAFDSEQSTTRIGQKVPVQTAQVSNFGFNSPTTGGGTNNGGAAGGVFNGGGFPVIQYQDTGLILKFTPQVFPNHDVQVKMEIESNDVAGGQTLTPVFSQRAISGMARIPNNRTMLLASVSQDKNSNGRRGLPLLGLIPVLGRLFSTPTRDDAQSDIVITVTPHVLRAPNVTPEDLELRPSGSSQSPVSESLEAMVRQADSEDQLAAARLLPTNQTLQVPTAATQAAAIPANTNSATTPPASGVSPNTTTLPVAIATAQSGNAAAPLVETELPAFVPAPKLLAHAASVAAPSSDTLPIAHTADIKSLIAPANIFAAGSIVTATASPAITSSAPPATVVSARETVAENRKRPAATPGVMSNGGAALFVLANQQVMRAGEKQRLMILIKTDAPLGMAATSLRFDPKVLRVLSVTKGNIFGETPAAAPALTPSIDVAGGTLLALVAPTAAAPIKGMGVLLFVEVEALAAGETEIGFDQTAVHLMSTDGRHVAAQVTPLRLTVK